MLASALKSCDNVLILPFTCAQRARGANRELVWFNCAPSLERTASGALPVLCPSVVCMWVTPAGAALQWGQWTAADMKKD